MLVQINIDDIQNAIREAIIDDSLDETYKIYLKELHETLAEIRHSVVAAFLDEDDLNLLKKYL